MGMGPALCSTGPMDLVRRCGGRQRVDAAEAMADANVETSL